jgi:ABC-type maltose transport system permease subunit
MYVFLFVDTVTDTRPGEMIPNRFTLEHWRFLWENIEGKASVWLAMLNTMIFASSVTLIVLSVSSTASYAISRLNIPFRKEFMAGILMLHAFPSITLIIAIFLILQMVGLYNTLIGVILVKASMTRFHGKSKWPESRTVRAGSRFGIAWFCHKFDRDFLHSDYFHFWKAGVNTFYRLF